MTFTRRHATALVILICILIIVGSTAHTHCTLATTSGAVRQVVQVCAFRLPGGEP